MKTGQNPGDGDLLETVTRRTGPVLLVGSWPSRTVAAVARCSTDVTVIALAESDAVRIRRLAATEQLPGRLYLPSAAVDPVDRDVETGVRWSAELFGPVPALGRIAVAAFSVSRHGIPQWWGSSVK